MSRLVGNQQGGNQQGRCRQNDVDMTPMVDVTFLLLIFFMVTASFSLQKSIAVPPSPAEAGTTVDVAPDPTIKVQVDSRGTYLVMTPAWEFETPAKQKLTEVLKQAIAETREARLTVEVHERAKLQSLVNVLDAGTSAGFTETRVIQIDQVEAFDIQ